jgi:hypothetical protein
MNTLNPKKIIGNSVVVLSWLFGSISLVGIILYAGGIILWMHAPIIFILLFSFFAILLCLKISVALNDWGRDIKNEKARPRHHG